MIDRKNLKDIFSRYLPSKQQQGQQIFDIESVYKQSTKCVEQDMPKIGCVNHDCDKCKEQSVSVGEPVAWLVEFENGEQELHFDEQAVGEKQMPLYTTPQQRKPLTDEQIFAIGKELGLKCRLGGNPNIDIDYARAIEAAHGIKENK